MLNLQTDCKMEEKRKEVEGEKARKKEMLVVGKRGGRKAGWKVKM